MFTLIHRSSKPCCMQEITISVRGPMPSLWGASILLALNSTQDIRGRVAAGQRWSVALQVGCRNAAKYGCGVTAFKCKSSVPPLRVGRQISSRDDNPRPGWGVLGLCVHGSVNSLSTQALCLVPMPKKQGEFQREAHSLTCWLILGVSALQGRYLRFPPPGNGTI